MDRIDLFEIYQFGNQMRSISDLNQDNTAIVALLFPLWTARSAVSNFLSSGRPLGMPLTAESARELIKKMDNLEARYFKNEQGEFTYPSDQSVLVNSWEISVVQDALKSFVAIFKAEMQVAATYMVPRRGIYDVADLVDRASNAFPAETLCRMNEVAIKEYNSAGRCFAFGLYTASGYHSCRSVEAVLRDYYKYYAEKDDAELKTWNDILIKLEKINSVNGFPDPKTISHMKHIKDFDRNPLSHLRANLDMEDADVLFADAKIVITSMIREMKLKKETLQPTLPLAISSNQD